MSRQINTYTQKGGEVLLRDKTFPRELGGEMRIYGHVHWRKRPEVGDIAIIKGRTGMEHHLRFIDVEHCNDPKEMYFGTAKRFKVIEDGEVVWEAEDEPEQEGSSFSRFRAWLRGRMEE